MPKTIFLLATLLLIAATGKAQTDEQKAIMQSIEQKSDHYWQIAKTIWEYAEPGYLEFRSSQLLQDELSGAGFRVEAGVAEMPTAFLASYGSGHPIVGILAEFDALPGISQEAVPHPRPREGSTSAHACGHHLFGTASVAAAIAIKDWMDKSGMPGTIRVYGTPAEEGGAGKVYMVRAGLFKDVDAVLHWHPGDDNSADATSSLANKSAKFRFYGQASHASSAPDKGRSALDAVEAMNFMANMMREHIPMESRIHYVITRGGEAPNVVPAFAEVFYYCRHPEMEQARENFEWLVQIAQAAAMGTQTRMEYEVIHGSFNLMPNETLGRLMHKNLQLVGGIDYTPEEMAFAKKIAATFPDKTTKPLNSATEVKAFEVIERGRGGSTDVGDVSWNVPTTGMRAATWVPGTSAHSWQAVAAGGMSIGKKGALVAAKTLALTAIDILKKPAICEEAKKELEKRRGPDFHYTPLLGNRKPPLDYRK